MQVFQPRGASRIPKHKGIYLPFPAKTCPKHVAARKPLLCYTPNGHWHEHSFAYSRDLWERVSPSLSLCVCVYTVEIRSKEWRGLGIRVCFLVTAIPIHSFIHSPLVEPLRLLALEPKHVLLYKEYFRRFDSFGWFGGTKKRWWCLCCWVSEKKGLEGIRVSHGTQSLDILIE